MTHTEQLRAYSSTATACPDVWTIQTPGTDLAVRTINKFIRSVLDDRADDDVRTVRVVASELTTNALIHSASGEESGRIRVDLEVDNDTVTVHVYDDGAKSAAPNELVDLARDGGLGLTIAAALADELGEEVSDDGLHVWARMTVRREESAAPPAHTGCGDADADASPHPPGEPET